MRSPRLVCIALTLALLCAGALAQVDPGIVVLIGDTTGEQAVALAGEPGVVVYSSLTTDREVAQASRAADEAGLFGTRVFVGRDAPGSIGLADNIADRVVCLGDGTPPEAEILRVLRPEGVAELPGDGGTISKPVPQGVDDWTHHYHGPDNNPQSEDTLARAPYLTQFVAEPRYGTAPQMAVSAAGRVFMAFGHVAWHEREEQVLNTLIAVNGYNGTELWRRPLAEGIMVDRSTMVATPEILYLADHESCKLIDVHSGQVVDEIAAPDFAEGPFWKWMALQDGVLYAMVGKSEPADDTARWRAVRHGWPWNGISEGYNADKYTWGLGRTLFAMDLESREVLWHLDEPETIDSRTLCMTGDRVYYATFGRFITSVNAKTGETVWRRTIMDDPDIFAAIGPYRPGHGYIGGWKSTVYLKCTDQAVYVVGPQVERLTALSAENGWVMWEHPVIDLHIVVRDDGLYVIGPENSQGETRRLDPLTGEVLETYGRLHRRACTRSVGSVDGVLFRSAGGSARLDSATGQTQWISPMRPSCHIGVLISSGHLYWVPWVCDCNLQMFGLISAGPAGDFDFSAPAGPERLTVVDDGPPTGLEIGRNDWPTYRANNRRTARTRSEIGKTVTELWTIDTGTTPTAPTAAGGLVFLGGADGITRAVDIATGQERWHAYTGGRISYPPSIEDGRAFVGAGDGCAHALDAMTGRELWRFQAAPAPRRIPFYGGLISTWPVGSGVLVDDGTAYLACGIMDYDGTHVYALDATTGGIKWQNNTAGHLDEFSHRGVACQGELLLNENALFLAGGNAMSPGAFEAATGKCWNQPPTFMGTRFPRGRELTMAGHGVRISGQPLYSTPDAPVFDGSTMWADPVVELRNAHLTFRSTESSEGTRWALVARTVDGTPMWEVALPAAPVRWGMAVDDGGRIVVTMENGQVVCFG